MHLSDEQSKFVKIAQEGKNILVDACIGSGKTTAIQALCKELPRDKKILYLTYNKLLKIDAKSKIHGELLFTSFGMADAVKDDVIYELKFVSELTHEHFLQCASYVVAMGKKKGILWNTRDNTLYEITVPNKSRFLDAVTNAITKGAIKKYNKPSDKNIQLDELRIGRLQRC